MKAIFLSLILVGTPVCAQEVDCGDAMTQQEMNRCAAERYTAADVLLNKAWKPAMKRMREIDGYLPEDQRGAATALRDAQRVWIKYRDAACGAEGWNFRGGSLEPFIVASCLEDLTRARTQRLLDLVETY